MSPEKKPSAIPPARGEAIDQYRTVRTRNIGRTSASVAGMGRTVRINASSAVRNIAPRASWFTAASARALRRGHALNALLSAARNVLAVVAAASTAVELPAAFPWARASAGCPPQWVDLLP